LIDQKLFDIVLEAFTRSFTVQSDFARANAPYVAMAASLGLISTKVHNNIFSSEWRPTVKGLTWLDRKGIDVAEETWSEAPVDHTDTDEET
jgi:hypothetical protein